MNVDVLAYMKHIEPIVEQEGEQGKVERFWSRLEFMKLWKTGEGKEAPVTTRTGKKKKLQLIVPAPDLQHFLPEGTTTRRPYNANDAYLFKFRFPPGMERHLIANIFQTFWSFLTLLIKLCTHPVLTANGSFQIKRKSAHVGYMFGSSVLCLSVAPTL